MRLFAFLILSLLVIGGSRADEIEDALNAAIKAHKENKDVEALTAIQNAQRLLNEKAGLSISAALPKELGEWTRGKIETQAIPSAGGTATTCSYRKGDKEKGTEKRATVTITADSPMLNQLSAFLKAPAIGQLLGQKPKQIGAYQGMMIAKEGIIQFAVSERYMVVVQGKKLGEEELTEIAKGVKTDVLTSLK